MGEELVLGKHTFRSRLFTGTGKYADLATMRAALAASGSELVTVAVRRLGDEAVVTVSDLGVGLPAADLPKLFQRFFRASTHGGARGTGLGLYTARLLVEAHGGRIWAESEVGRGSRFHFALPLEPTTA